MDVSGSRLSWRWLLKSSLAFAAHQMNVFLGISILSAVLVNLVVAIPAILGLVAGRSLFSTILTGTPSYPVQILIAIVIGFLLSSRFQHGSMLWVWLLSLAVLLVMMIIQPLSDGRVAATVGIPGQTVWSHYFGWGCRQGPCVNQVVFTLPFYVGVFYSLGSLLGRKAANQSLISKGICVGLFAAFGTLLTIAALAPVIALLYFAASEAIQFLPKWLTGAGTGWVWTFVILLAVVYPAAIGLYLLNCASSIRRQGISNTADVRPV